MDLEGWNSHHLPSTNWRTRKDSDVIQSISKDLKPRDTTSENRKRWLSQLQRSEFTPALSFSFIQAFSRLDETSLHGTRGLLKSTELNAVSSRNALTDTPRNNVLPSILGIP